MDEFIVRAAPKVENKKQTVFKSHKDDNIIWNEVKMKRENDYQPWQIKVGSGRTGRRFKAVKEGGVNENASYFIFYKTNDKSNTYEVCPVDEWYSVSATQRYKTLTAEEAEQAFEQRHKMLSRYSVKLLRKNGENGDEMGGYGNESKSFKVSEMDDWDNSGDDEGSDDEGNGEDSKKKVKSRKKKDKEEPEDAPDEGKEDSDEGDFEQREVDYMSDSSSESSDAEVAKDTTDVKGIAEEGAMRDLLSTDDEEDPDNPQQKTKKSEVKTTLGTVDIKNDPDGYSSDSSGSDDYDVDEDKMDSLFVKKGPPAQLGTMLDEPDSSANRTQTTSGASVASKRKLPQEVSAPQTASPPRKLRTTEAQQSNSSALANISNEEKIVEEVVRKYLSRKPMTVKGLLMAIKGSFKRMTGITQEMHDNLVEIVARVLKRIPLDKQKINESTYLSLKET